jgi:hypothetical protein
VQDRYAGDVGDYVKLALLRALAVAQPLGIVWYRVPDEAHNTDGKHTRYLKESKWRRLDPLVFDALQAIIERGDRSVSALEGAGLFPEAAFFSDYIPMPGAVIDRVVARLEWIASAATKVAGSDLVFMDPDNGLAPEGFNANGKSSIKSATISDLRAFAKPGRTLIVYHHHTRRPGGHFEEIRYLGQRLRDAGFATVDAVRAGRYSPRVFFVLDATDNIRERAQNFCTHWAGERVTWHPDNKNI